MPRILYFGIAREIAGVASEQAGEEVSNVETAWKFMIASHPELADIRNICRLAIDMEYAGMDTTISSNSEIALVPPVAGG